MPLPPTTPPPAYALTCVGLRNAAGCGWYATHSFDRPLPERCPKCDREIGPDGRFRSSRQDRRLKVEVLVTGTPYQHDVWKAKLRLSRW